MNRKTNPDRSNYKKAKRRLVTPFKVPCILLLILSLIITPFSIVFDVFDNTISAYFGGSFWKFENQDDNAVYYSMDFNSVSELEQHGRSVCYDVEAEGAVLLMNHDALPLRYGSRVSCFSSSSVNLVYGGTGSGNIDASSADNLRTALEKSGFFVNDTLWKYYSDGDGKKYTRKGGTGVMSSGASVSEVPWNLYPSGILDSVSGYGDAAIIVISRVGGEGYDMEFRERNYLALDQDELDLLQGINELKKEGVIKQTILLLNTANAIQLDFLDNDLYGIDACLWIGDVGITGINAVCDILAGKISPSGSLADTWCFDNYSSPAMVNNTPAVYKGYDGKNIPGNASSYMVYQEGIYVGYRYYETRYEDFVMGTGNAGQYNYSDIVACPFGFGLSYTNYSVSNMLVIFDSDKDSFCISVDVTNIGQYSGKKTVQIYSQSPFTDYDIDHNVEKASVTLCGFGKTKNLQPGETETLSILVNRRELASYDSYGAGTYILDSGTYYLSAAENAHDAVNSILAAKGYSPQNTDGRMDGPGCPELVYGWNQEEFDADTYSTSPNGTPIRNQLSCADILLNNEISEDVTFLSRSNWVDTFPAALPQLSLTDSLASSLQEVQYNPADYPSVSMPVLNARNGVKLFDAIGADYDDPIWDSLLDELSFGEMVSLIGDSFHWRMPLKSIESPGARDENGPQGLTASLLSSDSTQLKATAFTSEDVMAASFNTALMHQVGNIIGNDCLAAGVSCLYGPGNNTHRTPYGGRNFEYYSEDGFLAGTISASEIAAIQEKGVDVMMKHFALNDCEQDRIGLGVWISEQAAREIYLTAFRIPFESGNACGVMAAYTRWGATWSGGNYGLMTGILRNEWGSEGMSITDNVLTPYVNGADGILAGVSAFDAMLPYVINQLSAYRNDPVIVNAMRQACHRTLYSLANSSAVNGLGPDTTVTITRSPIFTIMKLISVICILLTVLFMLMWFRGNRKFHKTEAYMNYKLTKRNLKKSAK